MVKLARNEQCITLYPLTARYSVGRFQPKLTFGLLRARLFLGSFAAFGYLRPVTVIFCLWAKFIPSLQSARLWTVSLLGHFHSITKYGLLTMARYGRPMNGRFKTSPFMAHNAVCYWPMFADRSYGP